MAMLQPLKDLEIFYQQDDPWQYENTPDDKKRKEIILSEIPNKDYKNVLDIGCGHGFITRDLPGKNILGVDISSNAIIQAKKHETTNLKFIQSSIFDIPKKTSVKFDLIIITGVLYPQYIGSSHNLIYLIIDQLIVDNGILICCHIDDWYRTRFSYLMLEYYLFEYRQYTQRLEIYVK
ncbi:MAG: class I SAM-dependent methyltransferase [Mojavia pulchra JT2-VF2]|jgi:2-polyprenyl-3-methyl-5-hydroxy-6-metoxy-1,4-benzoquinol methylase|uniref:Class I SAM-dependent methyltransferase n=1 Tax=Mojavia pulchra JT2-VF2 TaxID=287848 RepID=A0A951UGM2_9NOST|nr:class I SAM-dependent methyltransferase [Mojavia pulchra JT2-VF2]